ncbi:MAG: HesA/MoeB/ThiF family protein [Oligoflexia bacterium]|nr:HesA/MoeB/ThiF family protein [Oligoflexia bacterium]
MKPNNRFSRQKNLTDFGSEGQNILQRSSVLIIGCGGLGSPVAMYLASAGVGRLGLVDPDRVDLSNLQRQIIFSEKDIRKEKVLVAQEKLMEMNSSAKVEAYLKKFSGDWALEIAKDFDLLIDCSDNFQTKYLLNDLALVLKKPFVQASVTGFEGRLMSYIPGKGPCFRCLYPNVPKTKIGNCQEEGVLGPTVGVIGSWQALESIKVLLNISGHDKFKILEDNLLAFDFLTNSQYSYQFPVRAECLCQMDSKKIPLGQDFESCDFKVDVECISWQESCLMPKVKYIDVREENELESGTIPGGIHWPLSCLLKNKFPDSIPTDSTLVVYCSKGIRSQQAVSLMKGKIDHVRIYSLLGGINAYSLRSIL